MIIDNLLRFIRFFFSITIGLILTILQPIINIYNKPFNFKKFISTALIILFIIFIIITLKSMLNLT
uniref:ORF47 n=1 Tax=Galdieria phlegrea TaxID=1389228 RepID=UPI0023D8908C|nr:ORF47 [Galdieria phlegrea]UNJ16253.1 hypothetical protein [Galdieria sp.]WDA99695.1 ORF47 [Galdieria sulphuraria]WDA99887.1 ORF47 [Galdieria phlegrea]